MNIRKISNRDALLGKIKTLFATQYADANQFTSYELTSKAENSDRAAARELILRSGILHRALGVSISWNKTMWADSFVKKYVSYLSKSYAKDDHEDLLLNFTLLASSIELDEKYLDKTQTYVKRIFASKETNQEKLNVMQQAVVIAFMRGWRNRYFDVLAWVAKGVMLNSNIAKIHFLNAQYIDHKTIFKREICLTTHPDKNRLRTAWALMEACFISIILSGGHLENLDNSKWLNGWAEEYRPVFLAANQQAASGLFDGNLLQIAEYAITNDVYMYIDYFNFCHQNLIVTDDVYIQAMRFVIQYTEIDKLKEEAIVKIAKLYSSRGMWSEALACLELHQTAACLEIYEERVSCFWNFLYGDHAHTFDPNVVSQLKLQYEDLCKPVTKTQMTMRHIMTAFDRYIEGRAIRYIDSDTGRRRDDGMRRKEFVANLKAIILAHPIMTGENSHPSYQSCIEFLTGIQQFLITNKKQFPGKEMVIVFDTMINKVLTGKISELEHARKVSVKKNANPSVNTLDSMTTTATAPVETIRQSAQQPSSHSYYVMEGVLQNPYVQSPYQSIESSQSPSYDEEPPSYEEFMRTKTQTTATVAATMDPAQPPLAQQTVFMPVAQPVFYHPQVSLGQHGLFAAAQPLTNINTNDPVYAQLLLLSTAPTGPVVIRPQENEKKQAYAL